MDSDVRIPNANLTFPVLSLFMWCHGHDVCGNRDWWRVDISESERERERAATNFLSGIIGRGPRVVKRDGEELL